MVIANSLDVDVDVDWLYKGRRKPKAQQPPVRQKRSSSVSNGSLSHVSAHAEAPGAAAVCSSQPAGEVAKTPLPPTPGKKSSDSATPDATGTAKMARSHAPQRSKSVNEANLGSGNSTAKTKKTLFGSLFRRNSHGASDRPSIPLASTGPRSSSPAKGAAPGDATSTSVGAAPATPPATAPAAVPGAVSTPNSSSMNVAVSQFLKEPSSPEVKDPAPIHEERFFPGRASTHRNSIPFENLASVPLRRVTFAVDRFGMDPPQQIPSRKPKRGDVLIPQDMICPTPSISVGITNTQGSVEHAASLFNEESKEYKAALENHRKALRESDKHQQEAHYAAQRIAHEVANFKSKSTSQATNTTAPASGQQAGTKPTTTAIDDRIKHLEIDKPIHKHENYFDPSQPEDSPESQTKLTLDKIYTRCCHLREILPIPSTLKQVKNKTAPLQMLKFLNPRPTLIDLLSFCDFISITPIHNVVFDNVNLTPEMLRIVITSLANSGAIEKLGFRNVIFNSESWKLLCRFLLRNDSLLKLDISQTKIKPDLAPGLYRAHMDWNLFTDVLQRRRGRPLEELLINGVRFDNFDVFVNLLSTFASTAPAHSKKRLGIAQSSITGEQLKFLMSWVSDYQIQGVDLGFNDLSELVKPLVGKLSALPLDNMHYFTLNSTNIATAYDAALILRAISKLPNLYFLDLSNLPQIFPEIFPYLNKYLPRMANLKRLHLDSNDFTSREVVMVTSVLSKCDQLLHLSLLNIPAEAFSTAMCANVYDCVRQCAKLTNLDIAYGNMPEQISSRIALCLMRRMHRDFELDDLTNQDDVLFDGTLLSETAENVFEKLNNFENVETNATRRYLLKKYWERFNRVHDNVQSTIDQLFHKRSLGELNLQSKENLLRLLFVENNLSHILSLLKTYPQVADVAGFEPDTQPSAFEHDLSALPDPEVPAHVRPHLMATDSGRTIDVTTGKPVLVKQPSHVALVGKRQEEEEGEFHKWGFFVQQQNSIYPDHQVVNPGPAATAVSPQTSSTATAAVAPQAAAAHGLLPKIPSGTELRDAVMRAKGIDSIEELIQNVTGNRVTLDKIYGVPLHPMATVPPAAAAGSQLVRSSSTASFTSSDSDNEDKVDETYDKLLSSLSKVRSNK
ncbi:LADA_0C07492g1_1 [Lachancea dasiensis]|uniref:LADA_0C07492g1_1 n=1 Tax=Lachancea dasiensis TaxID=1072105 RepID=A0A1G4IZR1_9SACH|nr:LADA_0C07492g1_1 [Lachancea dasiensis]